VPCGPINTVDQGVAFAADIGLEPVVIAGQGDAGVATVRHPLTFSLTPPRYDLPPPRLDEHGDQIRGWLATPAAPAGPAGQAGPASASPAAAGDQHQEPAS
jgi:crotonobetainyl-CoA:carnitine CoA-transferase CaiB-like acyl-CoA transferase